MNPREEEGIEVVEGQVKRASEDDLSLLHSILEYNENIRNHASCYSSFKPLTGILIRFFRRLPIVLEGGVVIDAPTRSDFANLTKTASSGHRYSLKEVKTEFKFDQRAVIVSLPPFETSFKVGMEVITEPVIINVHKIDDTIYSDYAGAFVHPSSNLLLPPSDITSPHYGYAIVNTSFIRGYNEPQ